ncbi:MAG: 5-formyltetrahydrofolate cyclo-ligase [Porticoccaceae bacterium]
MTPGLRRELRQRRRQLSLAEQRFASERLLSILAIRPEFLHARRIAFYMASDGEIDPALLMGLASAAGKSCYLPALDPLAENRLHFVRYRRDRSLRPNRFGIAEPRLRRADIALAWSLDMICLPLVGFDRRGNRMGMGAGFYDRTLAFARCAGMAKPRLIGLAHSCQEVDALAAAPWDVPLDAIVTEREYIGRPASNRAQWTPKPE